MLVLIQRHKAKHIEEEPKATSETILEDVQSLLIEPINSFVASAVKREYGYWCMAREIAKLSDETMDVLKFFLKGDNKRWHEQLTALRKRIKEIKNKRTDLFGNEFWLYIAKTIDAWFEKDNTVEYVIKFLECSKNSFSTVQNND